MIKPAIIDKIFTIEAADLSNRKLSYRIPLLCIRYLQEHPRKDWYGFNCPMKLWCTTFEMNRFVFLRDIIKKCCLAKDTQKFDRVELGNGKRSAVRESDTVYYII